MTVSPMWLDACVCVCGMLTLVAGVARGATVLRTECNWPESSHAGAQPAKFFPFHAACVPRGGTSRGVKVGLAMLGWPNNALVGEGHASLCPAWGLD